MERRVLLMSLILVGIFGCANPTDPIRDAQTSDAQPTKMNIELQRKETESGIRITHLEGVSFLHWVDSTTLSFSYQEGTERKRVLVSPLHEQIQVIDGDSSSLRDAMILTNPNNTVSVTYYKSGRDSLINLQTGEKRQLELPSFPGSNAFDSWAPDGTLFLVQSTRDDKVPGFYFVDPSGKTAGSFHQQSFFSHWARWSPNSQYIAFLSVPIDTVYPGHPESWDEQPFAPQIGIMKRQPIGEVLYVSFDGAIAFGWPRWGPNSDQLAITCGDLLQSPGDQTQHGYTTVRNSGICVVNTTTGRVSKPYQGDHLDTIAVPESWSPDGKALLIRSYRDRDVHQAYTMLALDSGKTTPLQGEAFLWVDPRHLVMLHSTGQALALIDRQGTTVKQLATGDSITDVSLSPGGTYLAFVLTAKGDTSGVPAHKDLIILRMSQETQP